MALAVLSGCQTGPEALFQGAVVDLAAGTLPGTHALEFEPRDRLAPGETVVVAIRFQDCLPGSRCVAVRYWNGQYQDFQSLRIRKRTPGTEYLRWPPGAHAGGHRPGVYRVKVFLNGRFVRQVDYTVG